MSARHDHTRSKRRTTKAGSALINDCQKRCASITCQNELRGTLYAMHLGWFALLGEQVEEPLFFCRPEPPASSSFFPFLFLCFLTSSVRFRVLLRPPPSLSLPPRVNG